MNDEEIVSVEDAAVECGMTVDEQPGKQERKVNRKTKKADERTDYAAALHKFGIEQAEPVADDRGLEVPGQDRPGAGAPRVRRTHRTDDAEDARRAVTGIYADTDGGVSVGKQGYRPLVCEVCGEPIVLRGDDECEFGDGAELDMAQWVATGKIVDGPVKHRRELQGLAVLRIVAGKETWFKLCPCNGCGNRRRRLNGRPPATCYDAKCKREKKRRQKEKERQRAKR